MYRIYMTRIIIEACLIGRPSWTVGVLRVGFNTKHLTSGQYVTLVLACVCVCEQSMNWVRRSFCKATVSYRSKVSALITESVLLMVWVAWLDAFLLRRSSCTWRRLHHPEFRYRLVFNLRLNNFYPIDIPFWWWSIEKSIVQIILFVCNMS